jgi:hypothetical protein
VGGRVVRLLAAESGVWLERAVHEVRICGLPWAPAFPLVKWGSFQRRAEAGGQEWWLLIQGRTGHERGVEPNASRDEDGEKQIQGGEGQESLSSDTAQHSSKDSSWSSGTGPARAGAPAISTDGHLKLWYVTGSPKQEA